MSEGCQCRDGHTWSSMSDAGWRLPAANSLWASSLGRRICPWIPLCFTNPQTIQSPPHFCSAGFIAITDFVAAARTGFGSTIAAATTSSTNARHSSNPFARASRIGATRETSHSIEATKIMGEEAITDLKRGYTPCPSSLMIAKAACRPRAAIIASAQVAPSPRRFAAIDMASVAMQNGTWQRSQSIMSPSKAEGRPQLANN